MPADADSRALHKHCPNNAVPRVSSAAQTSFDLLKVALISALTSRDKTPSWRWTAHCYTQDSILLCVLLSQTLVLGQKPVTSFKKPQTSLKCEIHLSYTKSSNQNGIGTELQVPIAQEQPQKKHIKTETEIAEHKRVQNRHPCQNCQFTSFLIPEDGQNRDHLAFSSIIL